MNISLVTFSDEDFEELISWSGDSSFLLQWAGPQFVFPLSAPQLAEYNHNANNKKISERLNYKVIDSDNRIGIGHISIGSIDRKNMSARLGKIIIGNRDYKGKGLGQNIVKEALKICFSELKLHKVSLGVFDFNTPALATYKKVGFSIDGVLRDARKNGNDYWNLIEMSMLENEWKY